MKKERVKLSVVTVSYNCSEHLRETLLSVFEQTYLPMEIIVIDGGSTDDTGSVLEEYDKYIHYWVSEPDDGHYDGMNKGIDVSSGDFLIFMNAGDLFYDKESADKLMAIAEGKDMVYGDTLAITEDGQAYKYLRARNFTAWNIKHLGTRTVCHQAIAIRKTQCPKYTLAYSQNGELNWYLDLIEWLSPSSIAYCGYPVARYRLGGQGYTKYPLNWIQRVRLIQKRCGTITSVVNLPVYIAEITLYCTHLVLSPLIRAYRLGRVRRDGSLDK